MDVLVGGSLPLVLPGYEEALAAGGSRRLESKSGLTSQHLSDLESGGSLEADIVTNALNVGVSFNF